MRPPINEKDLQSISDLDHGYTLLLRDHLDRVKRSLVSFSEHGGHQLDCPEQLFDAGFDREEARKLKPAVR
jgi:hypothetical protein